MPLCCICAERARKSEEPSRKKTVESSLPGDEEESIPTAFVKIKKSGDERECNFHFENELIPELYNYYCSDCAAVKLQRDPSINDCDHEFVNERVRNEEECTYYRLWLQFTATINEMLRRKHHNMAQHSIILSSRENFLKTLEAFVKTHIPLPINLRDYRRDQAMLQKYGNNTFFFCRNPKRVKEDNEMMEMLRSRPIIDEDESYIQISQMLIGKTSMETIPLSASAFAYFFYKSEMELIMEFALQKCADRITYWDKKIDKWIGKRNRFFSVLEKDLENATKHYSETKRELLAEAIEMHHDKTCEKIHVPFHFDSGYMKKTFVNHWTKVNLSNIRQTFKDQVVDKVWGRNWKFDLDRLDSKFKIKTSCLSAEELEKNTFIVKSGALKNREWLLPVVSFSVSSGPAGFSREAISNLLDYTIVSSGFPMKRLDLTTDWQLGIAMVGFNTRNATMKMPTAFYRVAIKLFKSIETFAGSSAPKKRRILMWCLDLDKQNIFWVDKVPTVYKLPSHLGPKVIPFQAYHVWYTDIPPKYECQVEEYQQKSLEIWHANSTNNQIKAFIERYMNSRGNHEIKISHAEKSKCPIQSAICNYGDVIVKNPHGEKQITLASWWRGIQTKHTVDRSPGKNREVKGSREKRQQKLCAFSKNVMLDKISTIMQRPTFLTLKQYDLCEEYDEYKEAELRRERLTRETQMLWRAVNKFPSYRRVMRILLKYLNEDERTRDYDSMFLEVMSLKQVEERRAKDKNYPDRFPKVTKTEMVEFLTSSRALATNYSMPCERMGNMLTQMRAFQIRSEKDEDKKNFYPTILMNMLNGLKILDNSIFIDRSNKMQPNKRTARRRNIRFTYRKPFNAENKKRNTKNNNQKIGNMLKSEKPNTEGITEEPETQLTEEEMERLALIEKFNKDQFEEVPLGNKWVVRLNGRLLDLKESEDYRRRRREALSTKKKDHVVVTKEELELEETEESNRTQTEMLELSTMMEGAFSFSPS